MGQSEGKSSVRWGGRQDAGPVSVAAFLTSAVSAAIGMSSLSYAAGQAPGTKGQTLRVARTLVRRPARVSTVNRAMTLGLHRSTAISVTGMTGRTWIVTEQAMVRRFLK